MSVVLKSRHRQPGQCRGPHLLPSHMHAGGLSVQPLSHLGWGLAILCLGFPFWGAPHSTDLRSWERLSGQVHVEHLVQCLTPKPSATVRIIIYGEEGSVASTGGGVNPDVGGRPRGASPLTFRVPTRCAVLSTPAIAAFGTKPPRLGDGALGLFVGLPFAFPAQLVCTCFLFRSRKTKASVLWPPGHLWPQRWASHGGQTGAAHRPSKQGRCRVLQQRGAGAVQGTERWQVLPAEMPCLPEGACR